MFYVFCGYINSDNYNAEESFCDTPEKVGGCYKLRVFETEREVVEFHSKWTMPEGAEEYSIFDDKENGNFVFRVFKGTELRMTPVEKVTEYRLEGQ